MDALAELVGESPAIEAVRDQIRRLVARREVGRRLPAILISGETGTGKGLVARTIHRAGIRARGPFVDVNCAAIPDSLLEAELFGFERGAFTDARRAKPGLFQAAHHGTIFLDEVGLLPEPLQAKLLKVLEEKAVRRLGATTPEPVDAWIISATNADLQGAVRQHMFREDLYHRLAVLTLRLPPLRERGRDILILAGRFLVRVCADYGLPPKRFAREAEARLLDYPWPGNIRELGNVIERVALLAESELVTADMLELQPMGEPMPSPTPAAPVSAGSLDDVMREHVLAALTQTKWNISRSAALLGISRNTLRARIDKLGLRAVGNSAAASPRAKRDERSVPGLPVDKALGTLPAAGMGPVRWERRRITLLRASIDVGGAGDDPTETSRLLGLVMDKVQSFGGRVEALAQSGFDASFGLDLLGDAPRRAANAALAIQKAVGRGAPGHTSALGVRLGLHIESCLVGNLVGSPQIDQQEKVKTSQFLETLVARADLGTIVVSDVIVPFLGRRFSLSRSARIQGTVGEAYRLVGHKSSGEGPWGRMAAFVGRREELDLLKGRWNAVTHGSGQVVGVVGEPGVGKSRLIWEFLRGGETAAALVLQTSADILGNRTPFLPVVDLLRAYFRIESGQDPDTIRRKVTDKLADLDRALIDAGAPVLALLDVSVNDRQWSSLDATQRRQLTLEALKAICVRESQREPLVLVFEDAHWIDSETQAVLDTLVERVPTARVLVLLTYRPEYQHGWGHKTFFTQLRVDPLPPQNVEEMLDAILGTHDSLTSLRSRLIEWTEGNPFFLEESVQALAEIGTLTGNLGAYRLVAPLTTLEVPGTVEELLAARVNRLPDRERALLQAASVIGREVPLALWSAIADLSEAPLRDALHRLRSAEFVYETSTFPQNIYTFRHALTQAVAYASLPEQQRRKLHARTLERMESLWPDAFGELADRFAHHALQGQVWDKAVAHLARAGTRAFARSANREAVASFEQALQALDHLADTRDTREQKIELHLGLRNALTLLGDAPRTLQHLHQAEALAEQIGDYPKLGRALSFEANALFLMGDHPGAIKAGSRALAIADTLDDFPLRTATLMYLGRAHTSLADFTRAIELLSKVVTSLSGDLSREHLGLPVLPAVFARSHLAVCLAETGRFAEAARFAEESIQLAEERKHPDTSFWAYRGAGVASLMRGDGPRASELLEQALAVCRAHDLPVYFSAVTSDLGHAYAVCDRTSEALPLLERAVEGASAGNQLYSLLMLQLGEGYLSAGRRREARECAESARTIAADRQERGREAHALRLLADVSRADGTSGIATAERLYGESAVLAERYGLRPLLAQCLLGLGLAHQQRGDREAALERVTEAAHHFQQMNMVTWLKRAQEALVTLV